MWKTLATGALGRVGDSFSQKLPASLDVAGLPVRRLVGTAVGVLAGSFALGQSKAPMTVLIKTVGAFAGGEAGAFVASKASAEPTVAGVGGYVGAAGGAWLAGKVT